MINNDTIKNKYGRKEPEMDLGFFKGKRVLITGHTGFKGSWMCVLLIKAGANIIGYSTCSKKETRLFNLSGVESQITHIKGDVNDLSHLMNVFKEYEPEIVIHMAAQPIVIEGYKEPVETYATNVLGTVNILECVRLNTCVKSFINVTTDKVYENREYGRGYREDDSLDGYDPYSNSKSCSELVTHAYKRSFFKDGHVAVSTARAGNVIGGGDFAKDRIIPDCVRAAIDGKIILVRNPLSIRPYQHVLEVIFAYLMIISKQYKENKYSGYYNIGPDDGDCYETQRLVNVFIKYWGGNLQYIVQDNCGPHEAEQLKLDCSRIKDVLGWRPRWSLDTAILKVVEWTKCWQSGGDVRMCMEDQIKEFIESGHG